MYLVPIENNYNDCLAAFSLKCSQKEISQSPVREQKLLMISHDGLGHPKTLGTLMDLLVDRDMDSFYMLTCDACLIHDACATESEPSDQTYAHAPHSAEFLW